MERSMEGSEKKNIADVFLNFFFNQITWKSSLAIAIITLLISLRDRNSQVNEPGHSHGPEDKKADVDSENAVERVPEDLAGRVCYELEPLVLSW